VRFLLPHHALRTFVAGYNIYGCFGPLVSRSELYFPPWTTIRLNYSQDPWVVREGQDGPDQPVPSASVFGPSIRHLVFTGSPQGISIGFGINPVGLAALLGVRADAIGGRVLDLRSIWEDAGDLHRQVGGVETEQALVEILDTWLLARLKPVRSEAQTVVALTRLLAEQHGIQVETVSARLGISPASLRRIALRHFGFPIKILLRRSRFMKSIAAIFDREPGEWSTLIDTSYHDQSHFIKDCHEFLGCSPGEFLKHERPMTRLSMAARQKTLGAPFFAMGGAAVQPGGNNPVL
jgi:AraC-like DNA-binding protein